MKMATAATMILGSARTMMSFLRQLTHAMSERVSACEPSRRIHHRPDSAIAIDTRQASVALRGQCHVTAGAATSGRGNVAVRPSACVAVAEAAVVGRPDDTFGEAIVAFMVLKTARPNGPD
ncbi:acyl-CoA synthetase (AMP-forming)/AMP-acid ligase II [Paraburkholderia sp. MM6662-R1]